MLVNGIPCDACHLTALSRLARCPCDPATCCPHPPSCTAYVLGLQAKQDLDQVKEMAGTAVRQITNMASGLTTKLLNDLSRY